METKERTKIESEIINALKQVFDPEIPVNIYDLGLIYKIDIDDDYNVEIEMTLTAPNCPASTQIISMVNENVSLVPKIKDVFVNLVFEPTWTKDMMSEEAKLELGFL
ncbi:MAG: FeS assembly SUF system protein [Bacteroidetes bacterium]|nr:MAG: FeS assembly SUF system protein [Bacteroidota bacterium]